METEQIKTLAIETAKKAGDLLAKGWETDYTVQTKEGRHNLVTEYDLSSQKLIIQSIKTAFPDHTFYAEENVGDQVPETGFCWIIDPLDGTVNFAHQLPFFSVSIGLSFNREMLIGVVFSPMTRELFVAEKGKGAFLNDKPIKVSDQKNLADSLLGTGFPYDAYKNPWNCIDRFSSVIANGNPIRRLGVASLDLAYLAAGRLDAFWEAGLQTWDIAAGKLILEEAGGTLTLYDGTPHPLTGYHPVVASNSHLHGEMVNKLKEDL